MKILRVCLVFVVGVLLGAFGMSLYRPRTVRAGSVRLEKVTQGFNVTIGSQVSGFACTSEDCYVLTQ